MSRFFTEKYAELTPYTPGEQPKDQKYLKLNANENPFPPSPEAVKVISQAEAVKLNLYPDPDCRELRRKLAELYGVKTENIFLSNGSDDILNFFFMAFCDENRPVVFPDITYGFYRVFADLYRIPCEEIPLKEELPMPTKRPQ